ncbi:MAG: HD domain-containing protein [Puniceicoccales bacterium]|jgi:tRNA nucleotidyltransferase (CCA-adding enzyme)|nr:HD domain-containing protein [Puniceicoccales bacterium]
MAGPHLTVGTFESLSRSGVFSAVSWICKELIAAGARPYFVGGCVRDAILGLKLSDFDVEIFGMPFNDVEKLLSRKFPVERTGKIFCVLKIRGFPIDVSVPRFETKFGNGHRDFFIGELGDCDVKLAASRRDFTINAIYFDVANGKIVDEFGGVGDLRGGILRHVGGKFSEDPLRVLRGMQFAGRFNLVAADDTVALCEKLSINAISRERIFSEWEKLMLSAQRPSLGLKFLKATGWLKFFPEIEELDRCAQDSVKHPEGSVFEHTCLALDVFAKTRIGDRGEDLILGFATLCHDIGKPYVTTRDERGIHHYGHGEAGEGPAVEFLRSINGPNYLVESILPLVKFHMIPWLLYENHGSDAEILQLANDVGRIDRLVRLWHIDLHGRIGADAIGSVEAENWLVTAAKRLGVFANKPAPIILGRDLILHGLCPSEKFSKILDQCFAAQLARKFTDHQSGIAYLMEIIQNGCAL